MCSSDLALKQALLSPPVLTLPNDIDTFILDTDAAEGSIGCVLSQLQDGQERVVAYAGRTLNRNEQNYCVTRKELLAIVHFTKHFRQYLLGRQFVIRTDHAALSWLQKTPEPIGQNARWLELLGEYDFTIKHRAGKSHGNADSISRHPCLNKPSCTACHAYSVTRAAGQASEKEGQGTSQATASQTADSSAESDGALTSRLIGGPADQFSWTAQELAAAQRQDKDLEFVLSLLESSTAKPSWADVELQSSTVKCLWHEWDRLRVIDGVLHRKWISVDGSPDFMQIVLPRSHREQCIMLAHTGMTGGHLGRSKTEEQVKRRAYWPGWRSQVASTLKKCDSCAQYHRGKAPRQTPLRPFGAGEPFEVVALDITGKHPRSSRGNEYIVTVTDVYSKWSEAYAVRVHTAPVVAKVLVDNFFCRFGMPRRLLTDQGPEFESQLFQELCKHMGIEKVRTSPYKPSTNGCVERFHRTLNSMLGKVVQENQRDWDDKLQPVMAAYRAAKHESTGFSPNYLVYGRENRAPIDIVLGEVAGEEERYQSQDDFVAATQQRLRQAHQLAREHLNAAAERRKDEYDVKVKSATFSVGDWVWYFYPRRYTQKSPKWSKNYIGPFLVTKVIEPSDYVIQRSRRAKPQVVHGDKLKRYHGEAPQSWLSAQQDQGQPQADAAEPAVEQPSQAPKPKKKVRFLLPGYDQPLETTDIPHTSANVTPRVRRQPSWLNEYYTQY